MSRAIEFRAWDASRKAMVTDNSIGVSAIGDILQWVEQSRGKYAFSKSHINYDLMQYTGLKDKIGNKIYEGDIVKIPTWKDRFEKGGFASEDGEILDAAMKEEYGVPTSLCMVEWDGQGFTGFGLAYVEDGKIIGNIYENPELIKDKDEPQ